MSTSDQFDLTRICDPDCKRHDLSVPWVFGGWRYASNGRIAVRVPANGEPDTKPNPKHPGKFPKAFEIFKLHSFSACRSKWKELPSTMTCSQCFGSGKKLRECRKCKGLGCKGCDKKGVRAYSDSPMCPACLGAKLTPESQEIGRQWFSGWLLGIVQSVPGCKYHENSKAKVNDDSLLAFIGDGGLQGVVAPLEGPPE